MTTQTRERLSNERPGYNRVFRLPYTREDGTIAVMQFYFTVNLYEDGRVGEVFVRADKPGSLAAGALDTCCVLISLLLQYGVPLQDILPKLRHLRFEPAGFTKDPEFPSCSSALDLLAQFLAKRFLPGVSVDAKPTEG